MFVLDYELHWFIIKKKNLHVDGKEIFQCLQLGGFFHACDEKFFGWLITCWVSAFIFKWTSEISPWNIVLKYFFDLNCSKISLNLNFVIIYIMSLKCRWCIVHDLFGTIIFLSKSLCLSGRGENALMCNKFYCFLSYVILNTEVKSFSCHVKGVIVSTHTPFGITPSILFNICIII